MDLSKPQFTQAQVLKCAPALSARTLQNWVSPQRGLIRLRQRPGRQGKILWSGLQVVKLAFAAELVSLRIPPRVALQLSSRVGKRAIEVHRAHPVDEEEDGQLTFPTGAGQAERYQRGYIFRDGDRHRMIIHGRDLGEYRDLLPDIYVTVECDRIIVRCLNRMHAVAAGIDPANGVSVLDDEAVHYHRLRLWSLLELEARS